MQFSINYSFDPLHCLWFMLQSFKGQAAECTCFVSVKVRLLLPRWDICKETEYMSGFIFLQFVGKSFYPWIKMGTVIYLDSLKSFSFAVKTLQWVSAALAPCPSTCISLPSPLWLAPFTSGSTPSRSLHLALLWQQPSHTSYVAVK